MKPAVLTSATLYNAKDSNGALAQLFPAPLRRWHVSVVNGSVQATVAPVSVVEVPLVLRSFGFRGAEQWQSWPGHSLPTNPRRRSNPVGLRAAG